MPSIAKRIITGALTGGLSGFLILGAGGRVAMRSIALLAGGDGGFSWAGTMDILLLGMFIGASAGAIYAVLQPISPLNTALQGLLLGILTFILVLVLPIEGKAAANGFPQLTIPVYLIFGGIFVTFGILQALLYRTWRRRIITQK